MRDSSDFGWCATLGGRVAVLLLSLAAVWLATGCGRATTSARGASAALAPMLTSAADRHAARPAPSGSIARERSDAPDDDAQAERDAAEVFRSTHADLLWCVARGRVTPPDAVIDVAIAVVVAPDGRVRSVTTKGGEVVGSAALTCIARRLARATFSPPRGVGARTIHVPFAFGTQ